jgi:hypothetical protein
MFSLISPMTKVAALTLSLGLTWATLGSVTTGFVDGNRLATSTATHYVQLPLVVVVGQREAVLVDAPDAAGTTTETATAGKLSVPARNSTVL